MAKATAWRLLYLTSSAVRLSNVLPVTILPPLSLTPVSESEPHSLVCPPIGLALPVAWLTSSALLFGIVVVAVVVTAIATVIVVLLAIQALLVAMHPPVPTTPASVSALVAASV